MRRGSMLIIAALAAIVLFAVVGVGLPFGPELLMLIVGVVIPGYLIYRVGSWVYNRFVVSG